MVTQRRVRIVPERAERPARLCVLPPTPPLREERRPPERHGFVPVFGRASGWYYRRERGR